MKRSISIVMALSMAISLLATGCSGAESSDTNIASSEGSDDKVLKVAVGCSLTGTSAKAGEGFEIATEMALEDIDYKIGDYTIEPIYVDLTDDPEKGALALEQAIVRDGAEVAMQGWLTTVSMSSMDVAAKYQIPYLFNYGAGASLDEKWLEDPEYYSYYVGKTYPTSDFIAEEYRDLIVQAFDAGQLTGEKKLAIYGEDSDWGRSLGGFLEEAFTEAGFEVVYNEYFTSGTTDFYAILSKIKDSGATVVAGAPNTVSSAAAFLKQAKEINLDATIIAHGLNEYPEWKELCGDAAEGSISQMQVYTDERGEEFEARFLEKAGYEATIGCEGIAYDCAKCTFEALQACYDMYGVLDTETIYKFATEEIQTGNWAYEDSLTQASYKWEEGRLSPVIGEDAFYNPLAQVQDGEYKIIFPASSAEADPVF